MKHFFKNLTASLFVVLSLVCCTDESIQKPKSSSHQEIKVENDYLSFKDLESLNKALEQGDIYLKPCLGVAERSFVSLQDIYQKAVEEDSKYFEQLEAYSEEELQKLYPKGIKPHSEFVSKNAELFNFAPEGWFELKIADPRVARFVNVKGIMKVGQEFRKYTDFATIISDKEEIIKSIRSKVDENNLPKGVTILRYDKKRKELSNAKIITQSFQVNNCTDRKDRYRVRLYEDILVQDRGNGTYDMVYGFSVHSFRHTVQGWQRRFATSALQGRVDYQASFGIDAKLIQANGTQESIGWTLKTLSFSSFNRPEITYSQGQGWGRNDCYCTYTGYY